MMRPFRCAIILLALAGCASYSPTREVAAIQSILTAAEKAALVYASLPLCSDIQKAPCAERQVLVQLRITDKIAYNAVDAAMKAARDPTYKESDLAAILTTTRHAVDSYFKLVKELHYGK